MLQNSGEREREREREIKNEPARLENHKKFYSAIEFEMQFFTETLSSQTSDPIDSFFIPNGVCI